MGFEGDRVLRAPSAGVLCAQKEIGDLIRKGDVIATVNGQKIIAPFDGALRGLIHDGIVVTANEKLAISIRVVIRATALPSPISR